MHGVGVRRRAVLASLPILFAPVVARAASVTLNWFMWSGSESEVAAWKHLCDMVHAKHPDITVNFQTASFPDYWTKLPALAASNQLPDIISLQSMRTAGFSGLLEPLEPYMRASNFDVGAFDRSIIAGLSSRGHLFALPYDFGPLLMFYNADMFRRAGVPLPAPGWTDAAFVKAARALTTNGVYGAALSVPDAFFAYAASTGAPYLNSDGGLDLTNPALEAAFTSYTNLVAKDRIAPLFPSSGTSSMSQANGRFVSGTVGMYVDGPWDLINVVGASKFQLGLAPIPAGKNGSVTLTAGSGFGIARSSPFKDAAWRAIQVLTGPEAETYLASQGRAFAARTDQQKYWYGVAAKNVVGAQPAFAAALKTALPYRTTPGWNTVSDLFEQYAPLAFGGQRQPDRVLKTIQQLSAED